MPDLHQSLRRALLRIRQRTALSLLLACALQSVQAQVVHRAVVSRVQPVYPVLAKRMRVTGTVLVATSIEPNGRVKEARATSGHALLAPAAVEAVLLWKFSAAPAASTTTIQIQFSLNDPDASSR